MKQAIVLKFKTTLLLWTICVNLWKTDKNQLSYFWLIGDKKCWSEKEQPVGLIVRTYLFRIIGVIIDFIYVYIT